MGDAFNGIRLTVGEVIVGVDAPLVTGLVVMGMTDAVHDRVAQVHVRRGHVDLGAQHTLAVFKLTGGHAGEQIQVLFNAAVAERAVLAGLGQAAAVFLGLLGRQVADVGLAFFDQVNRPLVQLIEVLRRVTHFTGPLEAQPLDVAFDGVDVFLVFFCRVGVVKTQMRHAAKLLSQPKVHTNGFGMTDVQIAVWLRRKAGHDLCVFTRV